MDSAFLASGCTAAAIALDEIQIAQIDEQPQPLAADDYRILSPYGIEQQYRTATDRKIPEGNRDHRFSLFFQ